MKKITYTKKDIVNKVSKKLNIPKDEIKIIFECILKLYQASSKIFKMSKS